MGMRWVMVLFPTLLFGLYCGNPAAPELPEVGFFIPIETPVTAKLGYRLDLVHRTDERLKYQMQQGVITVNWIDRVELYASLGGMKAHFKEPTLWLNTQWGGTWGLGVNVLLFYTNHFLMGVDAKFQSAALALKGNTGTLHYNEWQISPALSYESRYLTPYLGVAYHSPVVKVFSVEWERHKPFILFGGLGITSGKYIVVNLEGRCIGETAFSLSINGRF